MAHLIMAEEIAMTMHTRLFKVFLLVAVALAVPLWAAEFEQARIFIEYNSTDNDLGFHVFLDGEDWKTLKIVNPAGRTIMEVNGRGAFRDLGLTELFFEGAEPSLDDVPLEELLALFPEGNYQFSGTTVDGEQLNSTAELTYAVPDGPVVFSRVDDDKVVIGWQRVTGPADILPDEEVEIAGYQVIVGSFQVTLPASARRVTLPREYVGSLEPGVQDFEVLAIEEGGNQTISSSTFMITEDDDD